MRTPRGPGDIEVGVDLDRVDFVHPRTYADGDPHLAWRAMRLRDPVRWHRAGADRGFWSVTKYQHGVRVLRDHTSFTSEHGTLLSMLGKRDPAGGRQMVATDPPRHTRMREPLQRALTIKAVERSYKQIAAQVRRILAPAMTGEQFDLSEALRTLSMSVGGMLMGLPESDWSRLTRLSLMSVAPDDPEYRLADGSGDTTVQAHRELFAYFADIVRERIQRPGDDLISLLVTTAADGEPLDPGAVLSNCYSLLLGANVTTPYVVPAVLDELIGTPKLAPWLANPHGAGDGVEEALRWASPANHSMRHSRHDLDLGGRRIRAGDAVVVWLGSCNRDEDVFDDPYAFDPWRKPNRHIAFGAGPHYCVGHTVARVSLRILLDGVRDSFSDIERAGDAEHLASNFVAGLKHFPIRVRSKQRTR